MLFYSQQFLLLFLPVALIAYYVAAGSRSAREWILILCSLVFYGYWDVRFVPLLVISVIVNWSIATVLANRRTRALVALAVAANLGLLGYFKYRDFFADAVFGLLDQPWTPASLVLPLGISFFTFQQISYVVDLGRGKAPLHGFREYALFVSFFPQLVAGPIVRHDQLIPQFAADPRRPGLGERASRGLCLLVIGLIKKVVLADGAAVLADPVFAAATKGTIPVADAWLGAVAFFFQLYFDFSGYSDMALGLALLFGFRLPVNFDAPYHATSLRDFWRRWHITLSYWLRDYVYIPLGGSRQGHGRQASALVATLVLCGLWHGAGWTFVVWGAFHGLGLAVNVTWRRLGISLPKLIAWSLTMAFVFVGWVLFRAEGFETFQTMMAAMGGLGDGVVGVVRYRPHFMLERFGGDPLRIAMAVMYLLPPAIALIGPTSQRLALDSLRPRKLIAVATGLSLAVILLQVAVGQPGQFIYFEF